MGKHSANRFVVFFSFLLGLFFFPPTTAAKSMASNIHKIVSHTNASITYTSTNDENKALTLDFTILFVN